MNELSEERERHGPAPEKNPYMIANTMIPPAVGDLNITNMRQAEIIVGSIMTGDDK